MNVPCLLNKPRKGENDICKYIRVSNLRSFNIFYLMRKLVITLHTFSIYFHGSHLASLTVYYSSLCRGSRDLLLLRPDDVCTSR